MATIFEQAVDALASRYAYVRKAFSTNKPPRHIGADVPAVQLRNNPYLAMFENEEDRQKAMAIISWIYADIEMISRNVWAADFSIQKAAESGKMVDVPDHPFLDIYQKPNPWMTKSFIIQYLIGWLMTSERGAFAYLAPSSDNPDELVEIWPINPNQIEPVKGKNYIEHWLYYPRGKEEKPFPIPDKYILWIRFADRFDYWKSMPPLKAATKSALIEVGIEESQDKLFNDSRGLPLTVVSLDKDLSPADFAQAKEQIKSDWEERGSTIAVTRAGQISTQSLGFTQLELQTMVAQNMTRDKIDSIFFGWAFRSDVLSSGEGIKEMDKIIKEQTYRPLFILLQDHLQAQVIDVFYQKDRVKAHYKDPRTYDRALNIQEAMIYSRWRTINEQRELAGEPAMDDPPMMPGYGELPIQLAINASFVASMYGLTQKQEGESDGINDGNKPSEVGNLEDVQDPEAMTNQMARGDEPSMGNELSIKRYSPAEVEGIRSELKRWKTVAKRELRSKGFATGREFKTNIIPRPMQEEIAEALDYTLTEDQLDELFELWASFDSPQE